MKVLLTGLIAALAVGVGAAAAGRGTFDGATVQRPTVLPNFSLHDQDGHTVSLHGERGKTVLLTFLYTHCPDVCPITAGNLNASLKLLPRADRQRVRILAVSVDPRRDTRTAVRRFVREHQLLPQFRYLTGTYKELVKPWSFYNITSIREAKSGNINHTLYTLLIDRAGKARVVYDATAKPAAVAHDLRIVLSL
jgi:protein SCO1/2